MKGKASSSRSRKVPEDGEAENAEAEEATLAAAPKSRPRSKAKAAAKPAPKRRGRVPRVTEEAGVGMGEDPASNLPDPDNFREEATQAVLQCLHDCKAAGTLGLSANMITTHWRLTSRMTYKRTTTGSVRPGGVKLKATKARLSTFLVQLRAMGPTLLWWLSGFFGKTYKHAYILLKYVHVQVYMHPQHQTI